MNGGQKVLFVWIPEELMKKLRIKLIKEGKSAKEVIITFLEYYCKDKEKTVVKKQGNIEHRKKNEE